MAVVVFECGKILFAGLPLTEEQPGGCGTGPAQRDGAELFARRPQSLAVRFFGALHHATVGDDLLPTGKARDGLTLLEHASGQDLPTPRHRLQAGERLHRIGFRPAGESAFPLAHHFIGVLDQRHLDRLADPGSGKVVGHRCAVGLVREPFADFGERGLTIGSMEVRSEFRPLARQRTARAE